MKTRNSEASAPPGTCASCGDDAYIRLKDETLVCAQCFSDVKTLEAKVNPQDATAR